MARRRNSPTALALIPSVGADFRIAQTFHAQKQAAALLFAKPLHRGMKARHAFAVQQARFPGLGLDGEVARPTPG